MGEKFLSFQRDLSIRTIGKGSHRADIDAKGFSAAEVAGHGPFLDRMNHRGAVGTGIDAGFAADTPMGIGDDSLGFRDALPSPGWADGDAGCLCTMLAHDRHINRNLSPFLHLNPGEGSAGSSFMGQTANQFAGLTART